jgi:hypothetical protein
MNDFIFFLFFPPSPADISSWLLSTRKEPFICGELDMKVTCMSSVTVAPLLTCSFRPRLSIRTFRFAHLSSSSFLWVNSFKALELKVYYIKMLFRLFLITCWLSLQLL